MNRQEKALASEKAAYIKAGARFREDDPVAFDRAAIESRRFPFIDPAIVQANPWPPKKRGGK